MPKRESRLMMAADEIRQKPAAFEDDEVTYWPRGLIQCTLPHSNPGNVAAYGRQSGGFYLLIEAGHRLDRLTGEIHSFGFPYGSYPRLVCSYLTREAKRNRTRDIALGSSLSSFMAQLGLSPTGGRWGTIPNLRKQVLALVNAKIAFGFTDKGDVGGNQIFADRYALWWDHTIAEQRALFPSFVKLSEPIFEEILKHAVPCDMRILRAIKQSSLGLDLYAWMNHKVFNLKSASRISWKALYAQFGSGYSRVNDFRTAALEQLRTIKTLYPELKYTLERGRIVIWPSRTSVLPMGR